MTKLTLSDVANLTNETSALNTINNNSALIEAALENTLFRDGTSPNAMQANIDLNSYKVINMGAPTNNADAVRKIDVDNLTTIVSSITGDSVALSRVLQSTNNLSELTDPATARANLGIGGLDSAPVNIMDFGGDNTGVSDNAAAINTILGSFINGVGAIYFPAGTYKIASKISHSVTASGSFVILGDGQDLSVLSWTAASGGFDITLSGSVEPTFHVKDITFETQSSSGGNALKVTDTTAGGIQRASTVCNTCFRGQYATSYYWTYAGLFTRVNNIIWDNNIVLGISTPAGNGIKFQGNTADSSYAVVLHVNNSIFNFLSTGIEYGSYVQGISVNNSEMNVVTKCIFTAAGATGVLAQLLVSNCEFSVASTGSAIKTETLVLDVDISNCLFICNANQKAIDLVQNAGFTITGNAITSASATGSTGVYIDTTSSPYEGVIVGNKIAGFATGISLTSNSARVLAWPNVYQSNSANYTDNGTNNRTEGKFRNDVSLVGNFSLDLSGSTSTLPIKIANNSQIVQKDNGGTYRNIASLSSSNALLFGDASISSFMSSPTFVPLANGTQSFGANGFVWGSLHYNQGKIYGSSSGVITTQGQAAAGTYNWNWPITAGSSGDLLTSGGGSSTAMTWTTPGALTKTDDTNVTLTLGGTPTTALVNAASLTLGWTGQLSVARGGTGIASGTSGGIPYYSGSTTIASSAALTANAIVKGGGAGAAPVASGITIDSSNNLSGVVALTMTGSFLGSSATSFQPNFVLNNSSNDATSGSFNFWKARGSSIVQSGDLVGYFSFSGYDGSAQQPLAQITAAVDTTPGASDMPGRLTFLTTPDGSITPTEAFRIDSSQRIQFASAGIAANGSVATALTSLGPTGSHTTVQEWIVVKGTGGAVRYIPTF